MKQGRKYSPSGYPFNCYKVLGLFAGASLAEIQKRYRKLMKEFHPDLTTDESEKKSRLNRLISIEQKQTKIVSF